MTFSCHLVIQFNLEGGTKPIEVVINSQKKLSFWENEFFVIVNRSFWNCHFFTHLENERNFFIRSINSAGHLSQNIWNTVQTESLALIEFIVLFHKNSMPSHEKKYYSTITAKKNYQWKKKNALIWKTDDGQLFF